jgi:predicted dehydrogenase
LQKARRLVDEGAIGDLTSMRIKFISGTSGGWEIPESAWAWRAEEHRRGFGRQTFDHGHHMWSVARSFMGEVEKVSAWIDSVDGDIDCPATIMWKFKNGPRYGICDYSHATELHVPSTYYACDEWFEITGSRGIIQVTRCSGLINPGPSVRLFQNDRWTEFSDIDSDWASSFRGSTDNFIAAIDRKESATLSAEEGREVLKMDIAIQESAKRCAEIRLDDFLG